VVTLFTGHSVNVPCKQFGCPCKAYAWIPSRPEDIGEFWFQRRRGFDVSTWRAKCRCKHDHEHHKPTGYRQCTVAGGPFHYLQITCLILNEYSSEKEQLLAPFHVCSWCWI